MGGGQVDFVCLSAPVRTMHPHVSPLTVIGNKLTKSRRMNHPRSIESYRPSCRTGPGALHVAVARAALGVAKALVAVLHEHRLPGRDEVLDAGRESFGLVVAALQARPRQRRGQSECVRAHFAHSFCTRYVQRATLPPPFPLWHGGTAAMPPTRAGAHGARQRTRTLSILTPSKPASSTWLTSPTNVRSAHSARGMRRREATGGGDV